MNEPVKESDIPIFDSKEEGAGHGLSVRVDGQLGTVFIVYPPHRGSKIVFHFDEPHPNMRFRKEFITKYFVFLSPGFMEWGHEGRVVYVERCGEA